MYVGDMDSIADDDIQSLPSEWSPGRPQSQPWLRGDQVLAGISGDRCRRKLAENIVLSVSRTFNIYDLHANKDYFHCSLEQMVDESVVHDLTTVCEHASPEVIDLT